MGATVDLDNIVLSLELIGLSHRKYLTCQTRSVNNVNVYIVLRCVSSRPLLFFISLTLEWNKFIINVNSYTCEFLAMTLEKVCGHKGLCFCSFAFGSTKNLTSDFCVANAASTSANLELDTCSSVAASVHVTWNK